MDLGTSIFQPLLDELDDLVKMEGNICLWHIQQLQPLVLDPKRPGREGGLSEAVHVQPRCHRNIYRLHNWMKLILLQLTCRTSRWYRQSRFVVPPQC